MSNETDFGYADKIADGIRRECESALQDDDRGDADIRFDARDVLHLIETYDHLRMGRGTP